MADAADMTAATARGRPRTELAIGTPAAQLSPEREAPAAWVQDAARSVDIEGLADTVATACLSAVFGVHGWDDEFVRSLRASVRQNVAAVQQLLSGRPDLEAIPRDNVHAFASVQAKLAIPQTSLQRSYRVSFFTMWSAWVAALQVSAHRNDVDRDEALCAQQDLTTLLLAYQDQVASEVADIYARDHDLLSQSRAYLRQRIVRDLLSDRAVTIPASDAAILQYPLLAHHLTVLLPSTEERDATAVREAVRLALPGSDILLHPVSLQATALWVARPKPWSEQQRTRLLGVLAEHGVVASCSRVHSGTDGFRAAYLDAKAVETVRETLRDSALSAVLEHREVALEILLLRDQGGPADFVSAELGPLAETGPDAERLRETLAVSLELNSHVATAERLGVHEHTVRNRLHRIEVLLGRSWRDRRTELQVALRLLRLMKADPGTR